MSVNKFGLSLKSDSFIRQSYNSRNIDYVRNNALCLNHSDSESYYDAKSNKIKRLSSPDYDTDAANKQYVDETFKSIKDQQNIAIKSFEEKIDPMRVHGEMIEDIYSVLGKITKDLTKIKDKLGLNKNNE